MNADNRVTTADLVPPPVPTTAPAPREEERAAMFSQDQLTDLRNNWTNIQTRFIDEPRKSVEEADGLVASTMQRLAESFAQERARLEGQWSKGGDVSTEDLRLALRRYRSFFDRLLSL
jgi:hypothetical protein